MAEKRKPPRKVVSAPPMKNPYYRCPRNGFLSVMGEASIVGQRHDPDYACCDAARLRDWIVGTKGEEQ